MGGGCSHYTCAQKLRKNRKCWDLVTVTDYSVPPVTRKVLPSKCSTTFPTSITDLPGNKSLKTRTYSRHFRFKTLNLVMKVRTRKFLLYKRENRYLKDIKILFKSVIIATVWTRTESHIKDSLFDILIGSSRWLPSTPVSHRFNAGWSSNSSRVKIKIPYWYLRDG